MKQSIFVCFCEADRAKVEEALYVLANDYRLKLFWDDGRRDGPGDWFERLLRKMRRCGCALMFLSANAVQDKQLFSRLLTLVEYDKVVHLALLDRSPVPEKIRFQAGQDGTCVPLYEIYSAEAAAEKLYAALSAK